MAPMKELYKEIKGCIVAFVQKYIPVQKGSSQPPLFPPIIGTGFVIRDDGLIVTNSHVAKAFNKAFRPPNISEEEWPVHAMLFKHTPHGMLEIPLEVLGVLAISKYEHGKHYYGPKEGPDLAIVHVKAKGLPTVEIDSDILIEEGLDVATAGFPMGTDALTAPGYLHQLTPTLQTGIISAVLPFASPTPHAFSINIMTQGGASGSPVFDSSTGKVLGVLYAGLNDIAVTIKNKDLYTIPTNISYVVPAHYIKFLFKQNNNLSNLKQPADSMKIDEMIDNATVQNIFEKGRNWAIKSIDSDIEETRIKEVSRIEKIKNDNK